MPGILSGTAAFTITKASQTIAFTAFAVAGNATSGGTVRFRAATPLVCMVNLTTGAVAIIAPGTCTVTANQYKPPALGPKIPYGFSNALHPVIEFQREAVRAPAANRRCVAPGRKAAPPMTALLGAQAALKSF